MVAFDLTKETLYNELMSKFGLEYRFKWFLVTSDLAREAARVMENETPPLQNGGRIIVFLQLGNLRIAEGSSVMPYFVSFDVKFMRYWSLIRYMYSFVLQYEGAVRPDLETFLHRISNQRDAVRRLYAEVRTSLEKDMSGDEFAEFMEHVRGITIGLWGELTRRLADETAVFRQLRGCVQGTPLIAMPPGTMCRRDQFLLGMRIIWIRASVFGTKKLCSMLRAWY
jgi:hypothetical protein